LLHSSLYSCLTKLVPFLPLSIFSVLLFLPQSVGKPLRMIRRPSLWIIQC
jgi:hypothetical protein